MNFLRIETAMGTSDWRKRKTEKKTAYKQTKTDNLFVRCLSFSLEEIFFENRFSRQAANCTPSRKILLALVNFPKELH